MSEDIASLYRLWLEDIARIREARRQTTAFFVSLNLAGYGALGVALMPSNDLPKYMSIFACIAFLLVNVSWILTDRRYAMQAAAKFGFALKLEKTMMHQPVAAERRSTPQPSSLAWWLSMERLLPVLFSFGFAGMALVQIPWAMPFAAPTWWSWLLQ